MASSIDATKPDSVTPTTASVRSNFSYAKSEIEALQTGKQDTLVSNTNIKTVNNTSLLGSGNIDTSTNLDGLTDVTITTPSNGQVLKYNGSAWVNGTNSSVAILDDLTDVIITSAVNGQVLKYNGTNWVNGTDATGGGGTAVGFEQNFMVMGA